MSTRNHLERCRFRVYERTIPNDETCIPVRTDSDLVGRFPTRAGKYMARSENICKRMRSDEPESALIFSAILKKSEQNLDTDLTESGHIWGYLASPEHYGHNLNVSEGAKFVKINQFYRRLQNFRSCTGVLWVSVIFYCIIHATCSNFSKSCSKHIYSLKLSCFLNSENRTGD